MTKWHDKVSVPFATQYIRVSQNTLHNARWHCILHDDHRKLLHTTRYKGLHNTPYRLFVDSNRLTVIGIRVFMNCKTPSHNSNRQPEQCHISNRKNAFSSKPPGFLADHSIFIGRPSMSEMGLATGMCS